MTKHTFLFFISCLLSLTIFGQAIKVELQKDGDQWKMLRGGEEYFVKGVGGHVHLDKAVEIGANSLRTWGAENAQEILDEAEEKGLTVMLGLWVQHERHGFDYDNKSAVKAQLAGFRKVVNKFKDHPALLMWGVGNEVDLNYKNTNVWDAVQDIAKMIHELDPNHPTSTVTAGLDEAEVKLVLEKAPDIDLYCVNTYGDIGNVKGNILKFGWEGPYMITEWGVNGHWESPNTDFNIPIEQTSREKADVFVKRYNESIAADPLYCIGSYAFLWGQKQETTSTWYGLFTANGESSQTIDELGKLWGKPVKNCAPIINKFSIEDKSGEDNIKLMSGDLHKAFADIVDPDNDKIKYTWSVLPESTDKKSGGDAEAAPLAVSGCIKKNKDGDLWFRIPKEEGPYRLFLFAYDGQGHFASGNIPFYALPRNPDAEQARGVELKFRKLDLPND
ncbi:MAG: hypothetical protein ACI8XB_001801 [Patiriisocius sp.]|jgi:hypothetical protein